jgi:protein phosphatase
MGTTIAIGVLSNGKFYRAHAGDSPIYMFRNGELTQLTKDHTLAQKMIDQGVFKTFEEARKAGVGSNILTRALGLEDHIRVDLGDVKVEVGDIFFACSDGLSAVVSNNLMAQVVERYGHDLELTAALLVRVAKEKGSRDNITVAIGRVEES